MTNLRTLQLKNGTEQFGPIGRWNTSFKGLPTEIGAWTKLETLELKAFNLGDFPAQFTKLSLLRNIDLDGSAHRGFATSNGMWPLLEKLIVNCDSNAFGRPFEMNLEPFVQPSLSSLKIQSCRLSSTIPPTLFTKTVKLEIYLVLIVFTAKLCRKYTICRWNIIF